MWGRDSAPSKPSKARQRPVLTAASSPLGALDQRVPRRHQPSTLQLSSKAVFVSGSGSSGQALAQLRDLLCASAAPANFRTTAGCGHEVSLLLSDGVQRRCPAIQSLKITSQTSSRCRGLAPNFNYRVDRHGWQRRGNPFGQEPHKRRAPYARQLDAAPTINRAGGLVRERVGFVWGRVPS